MTHTEVEAELAIRKLVARYCHAIVQRDDEAWVSTWDESGEWDVLGLSVHGRAEILGLYRRLVSGFRWVVQMASDGIVEVEGDRATGRWIVTEYLQGGDGSPAMNVGVYRDEYLRGADGAWRFSRRRFAASYMGPADLTAVPHALPEGF